jgi:S1-C subfamily serine protease
MFFFKQPEYLKEHVCRVIVTYQTLNAGVNPISQMGVGTGFFISEEYFLTCFHVVFATELRTISQVPAFQALNGNNVHSKLNTLYNTCVQRVQIETPVGKRLLATLSDFNEEFDIVLLRIEKDDSNKDFVCKIDDKLQLAIGERIAFGGFPLHHDYQVDNTPFSLHEGIIASLINTTIGGGRYDHYQINSINLGGNSGAPLFKKGSKKVIGIINGNMNFGNDNFIFRNLQQQQQGQNIPIIVGPFRVPLSIAYATPLSLIKQNTTLLNNLKN